MGFISIILFLIGFVQYFEKRRYITLIIIATLASGYFSLVNANFNIGPISIQHGDMALLLIFSLLPFRKKGNEKQLKHVKKALFLFLLFLFISVSYDLFFRGTSPMQIFRTIRKTGYLVFFFLIYSFSAKDYQLTIRFFVVVTVIHAILYVSQYIFNTTIISDGVSENEIGGARYNNWPTFLVPILVYVIFIYNYKSKLLLIILLIITAVLTQSRGLIISVVSIILLYYYFQKRLKLPMLIFGVIILIIGFQITTSIFPVIGVRFSQMQKELKLIDDMNYNNLVDFYHQGSLIFRWGVTYERLMYVLEDPVRIFLGVGYIPDMDITSPIFALGTNSPALPTGREQYNSVDILFPNIITRYGIAGSVIFLYFVSKFFTFSFKNRIKGWGTTLFAYLVSLALISFVNETFYNGFYFLFIFFFIGLTIKEKLDNFPNPISANT